MQFKTKQKKKIIINITSLIDVMFLLLIFLLISSTFLEQPGIKLELPETKNSETVNNFFAATTADFGNCSAVARFTFIAASDTAFAKSIAVCGFRN